jgi:hypothetical protein
MSRDDIIRMAREAGFDLFLFFTLAYEAGAAAEREACAKVCDAVAESANKAAVAGQYLVVRNGAEARRCSAAIRAQAADRLARHGIQIPEDEEYGNPSF